MSRVNLSDGVAMTLPAWSPACTRMNQVPSGRSTEVGLSTYWLVLEVSGWPIFVQATPSELRWN